MKTRLLFSLSAIFVLTFCSYAQMQGNPDNWCREGFFTRDSKDFGIGHVKAKRAYFYSDDPEKCPDGASCRSKSYVVLGDTVVTNRTRGNYVCSWYVAAKGTAKVGWLRLSDLEFPVILSDASARVWTGEWRYGANSITFSPSKKEGMLDVKGSAIWKGFGDNVHIGELAGTSMYKNGSLQYSDGDSEYDCQASMELATSTYLVVADNGKCGGANVTFSGVYTKVPPKPAKKKKAT